MRDVKLERPCPFCGEVCRMTLENGVVRLRHPQHENWRQKKICLWLRHYTRIGGDIEFWQEVNRWELPF